MSDQRKPSFRDFVVELPADFATEKPRAVPKPRPTYAEYQKQRAEQRERFKNSFWLVAVRDPRFARSIAIGVVATGGTTPTAATLRANKYLEAHIKAGRERCAFGDECGHCRVIIVGQAGWRLQAVRDRIKRDPLDLEPLVDRMAAPCDVVTGYFTRPSSWTCPVCDLSKAALLHRREKQWFSGIESHHHSKFPPGPNYWSNPTTDICYLCNSAESALRAQLKRAGAPPRPPLSPDELRYCDDFWHIREEMRVRDAARRKKDEEDPLFLAELRYQLGTEP